MGLYTSAADVKAFTGVTPGELKLADEEALDGLLDRWIGQISDLIDGVTKQPFESGDVPGGVENIALRAMGRMVGVARQHRDSPIMRVDDWNVRMVEDRVLTADDRETLRTSDYAKKRTIGFLATPPPKET